MVGKVDQISEHMNGAGYYTAAQIIQDNPLVTKLLAWNVRELNFLVTSGIVQGRVISNGSKKRVFISRADLFKLLRFIKERHDQRAQVFNEAVTTN